jgi:hypothetical protein
LTYRRAGAAALVLAALALMVSSCASSPSSPSTPPRDSAVPEVYSGSGRAESLLTAINMAKMDAVRNAVIRLIGQNAEQMQRERLQEVLYGTSNPNQYVYPESMETLRRENLGTIDQMDMVYDIRIRVNIPRIQETLDNNGITASGPAQVSGGGGAEALVSEAQGEAGPQSVELPDGGDASSGQAAGGTAAASVQTPSAASAAEQQFVQRYLNDLTYMVFYAPETQVDPFLMKTAVTQANAWLTDAGYQVVDPDQVEELKADAQLAYEEQTGGEISILQWIAQRLNADVYVEIDASATTRSDGGRYYAKAILAMKMFETSTARLLGSIPYTSPETFSRTSEADALANALQSSVYQSMPYVNEQSRIQIARQIENGIRYELVFINTADSRLMSSFRSRLRDEVRDLQTISQSEGETRYAVYFFGRNDEVEDLIYRVADQTPGMEYLSLVLTRGKSLTFDTGLLP